MNIRAEFTNIFNRLRLPTSAAVPGGINFGSFKLTPTPIKSGLGAGTYGSGFGTIVSPYLALGITGMHAGTIMARFQF